MKKNAKAQLEVHFSVLLFGMTGLFAKFLSHEPIVIVLGRVFFSSIFLGSWLYLSKETLFIHKKHLLRFILMGILLSLHWVTFFGSIQLSGVAIGLLSFSTYPIFVNLLTPITQFKHIGKLSWSIKDLLYSLFTFVGILIILPHNSTSNGAFVGAGFGVISGLTYGLFTIYNEGLVKYYSGRKVAFYEHSISTLLLAPFVVYLQPSLSFKDVLLLILLGTLFTGIGHALFINGLKSVSAYLASLITMLEPIYSILLAYVFFRDPIHLRTTLGGCIILLTVILATRNQYKQSQGLKPSEKN